jgi:hypothetical protein
LKSSIFVEDDDLCSTGRKKQNSDFRIGGSVAFTYKQTETGQLKFITYRLKQAIATPRIAPPASDGKRCKNDCTYMKMPTNTYAKSKVHSSAGSRG